MKKYLFLIFFTINIVHADEVRVLNWNTFLLPKLAKKTFQKRRTKEIASYLASQDYDFIFLQEVFKKSSFTTIKKVLEGKGYYHTGKPKHKTFKLCSSGLVIFSKYPLDKIKFHKFDRMISEDRYATKGILMATATFPSGEKIELATTHFQSKQKVKQALIREHNTRLLIDSIYHGYRDVSHPIIIGGDFNIDRKKKEFEKFHKVMESHNFTFLKPTSSLQATSDCIKNDLKRYFKPTCVSEESIDHIFLGQGNKSKITSHVVEVKNIKRKYKIKGKLDEYSLSDHYGVEATLKISHL